MAFRGKATTSTRASSQVRRVMALALSTTPWARGYVRSLSRSPEPTTQSQLTSRAILPCGRRVSSAFGVSGCTRVGFPRWEEGS